MHHQGKANLEFYLESLTSPPAIRNMEYIQSVRRICNHPINLHEIFIISYAYSKNGGANPAVWRRIYTQNFTWIYMLDKV